MTPAGEGVVTGTGVEATGNVQPYNEYHPDYTYNGEPHEQPVEVLKDLVKKIVA